MSQIAGAKVEADKTKVFISYSRRDRDFVDRLMAALEAQEHIEVFRDTDDILPTEEWQQRLERLIGEADTIVFCLSPNSTASDVCRWEAELAERLNKRIAPIVICDVAGDIPPALAKLNYICFTKPNEFDRSLSYLITALDADIAWIREHTRLGELSRRWEHNGKPKHQLLRSGDLDAAESWSRRRPRSAPEPTQNTISYLAASRKEAIAQARRARTIFAGVFVVFAAVLVAWRYEQWLKERYYWFTNVRSHVHTVAMAHALPPRQPFKDCAACPEMIVVPAGKFIMGSPPIEKDRFDDEDQREVTILQPFAAGRFEVTFAEWDACAANGDCSSRVVSNKWGRGQQPVIYVDWDDAKRYVAWLARITGQPYRLLSEAEWEYAARAGSTTAYSWGDDIGKGNANCYPCGRQSDERGPAPVGQFAANAFGLHDMHGNVKEWLEDCYGDYKGAPSDGLARIAGNCDSRLRVVRGGAWTEVAYDLRSARRSAMYTNNVHFDLGFRVARTLLP
ncbi:MAG: SUMF1/EgtB/PvdO family nonheme iron enzyme [Hyphomicrobiales bacterium]|nr:SUMF1/EgtB/PvdO family nonheme iron enzyme [Hyphomicrobiales bacterium]